MALACNKCGSAPPHSNDSWCPSCSAVEQLTAELRATWGVLGTRTIASDLICTCLRQVRGLRRLGLAVQKPPEPPFPPPGRGAAAASDRGRSEAPAAVDKAVEVKREREEKEDDDEASSGEYSEEEGTEEEETKTTSAKVKASPPSKPKAAEEEEPEAPPREEPRSSGHREGHREGGSAGHRERSHRRERSERRRDELPRLRSRDRREHRHRDHQHRGAGRKRTRTGHRGPLRKVTMAGLPEAREVVGADRTPAGSRNGRDLQRGDPEWSTFMPLIKDVIEVSLEGSSVNVTEEAWCALLVTGASRPSDPPGGAVITGKFLGCESELKTEEVKTLLRDGSVHMCLSDPCEDTAAGNFHVSKIRVWALEMFEATYLSREGKALLTRERKALQRPEEPRKRKDERGSARSPKRKRGPPPGPSTRGGKTAKKKRQPIEAEGMIAISSEEGDPGDDEGDFGYHGDEGNTLFGVERLRRMLRTARERIAVGGHGVIPGETDYAGDGEEEDPFEEALVVDARASVLPLEDARDTRGRGQPLEDKPGGTSQEGVREELAEEPKEAEGASVRDRFTAKSGISMLWAAANRCASLPEVGAALLWMMVRGKSLTGADDLLLNTLVMKPMSNVAMHRGWGCTPKPLFPLPVGGLKSLLEVARESEFNSFCQWAVEANQGEEVWLALSICATNGVAGKSRALLMSQPTTLQARAIASLRSSVKRALGESAELQRLPKEAEKELSTRFLSYTGEEVPKMQVITLKQIEPALPPSTHSGSIDALDLLCDGSRRFLLNPAESLLENVPSTTRLKSKVHIKKGDELALAKLLVDRRICVWVPRDDLLRVNNQLVLKGLFAVGKNSFLDSGEEIQRLIMNLVPTNGVFRHAQGATPDLPGITQYLSLMLNQSDQVVFYQSDMSAAFYLFRIPPCWNRMMGFNLSFPGTVLGFGNSTMYHLACAVIPMGWGSSVSIMQEIADRLTILGRLPSSHQVRRTAPLPLWLVETVDEALALGKAWFHVYLDNFCAMQRQVEGHDSGEGLMFHNNIEQVWSQVGILSSQKKKVVGEASVQELGALVDGQRKMIGGSNLRILKLIQSTLVVLSKPKLNVKWVQVLVGRWVHLFSFRRPLMVVLDEVWKLQSMNSKVRANVGKVRAELFGCCLLGTLLHTDLAATLSPVTTASDASSVGGAVGMSKELSQSGKEFVAANLACSEGVRKVPILVLSLFNGIGCCFRCYDLCGVQPQVGISYEISKEANRVSSRRWPWVQQHGDVRSITIETIRDWRCKFPEVVELHLWCGFPCVDLSAVRYNRKNLDGPGSGLFWEVVRVLGLLRQVYGFTFPVLYFCENVASMDREAEAEISRVLGTKPYRVDSAQAVPIHRPRFCWSNVAIHELQDVWLEESQHWTMVHLERSYPSLDQWLTPGAVWEGSQYGAVLPTAMKAIKRLRPPPRPAGYDRVDHDSHLRWEADEFRFPPYQYDWRFIVWTQNRWRLVDASERELLHGLGYEHTALCWPAGRIKDDPQGFEDARKSLVGDSFNYHSFVYFAAMACYRWMPPFTYASLVERMGLAPGFTCPLHWKAPMGRQLIWTGSLS
eukprot:Skav218545  [mRNA]  locus=scaffold3191:195997:201855:+ [translate_table: standard]